MRIVDHSESFKEHVQKRGKELLQHIAIDTVRSIKQDMAQSSGGRMPPPGENPAYGWHRARGAAGDAPARQSNRLINSIGWQMLSDWVVRIGSGDKRGRWTQYGTTTKNPITPRRKQFLAFRRSEGINAGQLLFTKAVKGHTVAPRPWLSRATDRLAGFVGEYLK